MKFSTILWVLLLFILNTQALNAQSKLVLNGAFINLNSGNTVNPIYLVVEDTASNAVIRNSGHIISGSEYNFLKRNLDTNQIAYLYPFGLGVTTYLPFTYTKTNSTPVKLAFSTWFTNTHNNPHPDGVSHMQGAGDSLTSAIDRFWTMESNNTSTGNFTFSYNGTENTTTNPTTSTFTAQYWNGVDWSTAPTGGNTGITAGVGNTTLPFSMGTGQFPFVLTRTGYSLPIELLSFEAQWIEKEKKQAILQWLTSSEMGTRYFEIQRSTDQIHYDSIGIVSSKGNNNQINPYSFIDKNQHIEASTFYYRLKILSDNHSFRYSETRILERNSSKPISVLVYPNPFKQQIQLRFNEKPTSQVQIKVLDIAGKTIYNTQVSVQKQNLTHSISLNEMAIGAYFVYISFNEEWQSFKLLKN